MARQQINRPNVPLRSAPAGGLRRRVAHEVNAAALPGSMQHSGDGSFPECANFLVNAGYRH
jgi:hypothetical protein